MENSLYDTIARSLREFGYPDVTAEMIEETDEARKRGEPNTAPHGIVSMFACRMLDEADERKTEIQESQ